MRILFISFLFLVSVNSVLAQRAIDTLTNEQGTMIIYANRTWEYLEDRDFDGVLNEDVYHHFCDGGDSSLNFVQTWNNNVCYTSNNKNDLHRLKDTVWLCVTDEYNGFAMPVNNKVTSRYGYRRGRYHNGIDLDLETGDTVYAAFSGKVRYARYNKSGFGNLIIIRHYNGLETFYAHLSEFIVAPNEWIEAGDPIGLGGNTGRSTGSHLHFETRFFDVPLNPEEIIDFKNKKVRDENFLVHSALFRPGAKASHNLGSGHDSAPSSSTGKKYYKIRRGDTLGHIARRNHTSVSRICKLNGIRSSSTLRVGRTLRVR